MGSLASNHPTVAPLSVSPLPQLYYKSKMGSCGEVQRNGWLAIFTVVYDWLRHYNSAYCVSRRFQYKHYPLLYATETDIFLEKNYLPNEIKMCRICTSNINCDSGKTVSGATGGEFGRKVSGATVRFCLARNTTHTYVGVR